MKSVQEAALSLYKKGEIDFKKYKEIEKIALKGKGPFLAAGRRGLIYGKAFKGIGQTYLLPAALYGIVAGIGKEVIVDPIIEKIKLTNSLQNVTKKVPILAEKDQNQLRDYFEVIKTYSPRAASNPLVAGHLINKMFEFGGPEHKLVQDIVNIESAKEKPNMSHKLMEATAKGFMSN